MLEQVVLNRATTARASWWRLVGVFAVFLLIVLGGIVGTVFLVKWLWTAL